MSATEPSAENTRTQVPGARARIEEPYDMYNSQIEDYQRSFEQVLQGNKIIDIISERGSPVVLDLMAPSGTLYSVFDKLPKDKPRFGLAVSLKDLRTPEEEREDQSMGIEQIAGDILSVVTWKKIEEKLAGRKADLIMERAGGGLIELLPKDRNTRVNDKFMGYIFRKLWRLLTPNNGMLLLHVVDNSHYIYQDWGIDINDWIKKLKASNIAVVFGHDVYSYFGNKSLMLVKTPESPKELPLPDKKP